MIHCLWQHTPHFQREGYFLLKSAVADEKTFLQRDKREGKKLLKAQNN